MNPAHAAFLKKLEGEFIALHGAKNGRFGGVRVPLRRP